MEQQKIERARWWLAQGFELVPLQRRSKYLVRGFGAHSHHITNEPMARKWLGQQDAKLGVVLGIHGLAVADFDNPVWFEKWRANRGKDIETLIEKSPRGYHVFFTGEKLPAGSWPKPGAGVPPQVEFKTSGVVTI